jgi:hypothetical protein
VGFIALALLDREVEGSHGRKMKDCSLTPVTDA